MASAISYGLCQTACNTGAAACYANAGFIFGAVTAGVGIPAAVATCNTAQGACMAACYARFAAEAGAEVAATGGWAIPMIAVTGGLAVLFGGGAPEDPKRSSSVSKRCSKRDSRSSKSSTDEYCSF